MIDEENMAVNEEVGDEADLDTTPVSEEQAPEEVETEDVEQASETTEEETETEGNVDKKGASKRIKELNERAKKAEEKAQSLAEKLAERMGSVDSNDNIERYQPKFNPQEPIVKEGEEITAEELNRRITERDKRLLMQADALSTLRQKQSEAVNRINTEANEAIKEYPELDPESDAFNPELSETVYESVENYVKNNPFSASVKTFVKKQMRPYQKAVAKEVGKERENIAKQVSQTALRPISIKSTEKVAEDMSVEDLEKKLGVIQA